MANHRFDDVQSVTTKGLIGRDLTSDGTHDLNSIDKHHPTYSKLLSLNHANRNHVVCDINSALTLWYAIVKACGLDSAAKVHKGRFLSGIGLLALPKFARDPIASRDIVESMFSPVSEDIVCHVCKYGPHSRHGGHTIPFLGMGLMGSISNVRYEMLSDDFLMKWHPSCDFIDTYVCWFSSHRTAAAIMDALPAPDGYELVRHRQDGGQHSHVVFMPKILLSEGSICPCTPAELGAIFYAMKWFVANCKAAERDWDSSVITHEAVDPWCLKSSSFRHPLVGRYVQMAAIMGQFVIDSFKGKHSRSRSHYEVTYNIATSAIWIVTDYGRAKQFIPPVLMDDAFKFMLYFGFDRMVNGIECGEYLLVEKDVDEGEV